MDQPLDSIKLDNVSYNVPGSLTKRVSNKNPFSGKSLEN